MIISDIDHTLYPLDFWKVLSRYVIDDDDWWNEVQEKHTKHIVSDPITHSRNWMNEVMLKIASIYGYNSTRLYNTAMELFRNVKFYDQAIDVLVDCMEREEPIVLCTANHQIGASVVVDRLRPILWNRSKKATNIVLLSSVVNFGTDWSVKHINVGDNKCKSVIDANIDASKSRYIFGDDPYVNDIGLFNLKP